MPRRFYFPRYIIRVRLEADLKSLKRFNFQEKDINGTYQPGGSSRDGGEVGKVRFEDLKYSIND
jgi:hypothetical protein